jgi:hypothetical protein
MMREAVATIYESRQRFTNPGAKIREASAAAHEAAFSAMRRVCIG